MKLFRLLLFCTLISPFPIRAEDDLWRAAKVGNVDLIEESLGNGAKVDKPFGNELTTPLMEAARNNHLEAVNLLIKNGAKLDRYSKFGSTPLAYASGDAELPVLKLLLAAGANINDQRGDGFTPLMLAANRNKPEIVQWLIDQGADIQFSTPTGWNAMFTASQRNNPENIKVLLTAGMKPTYWNRGRWSPLMVAAQSGHVEVIQVLLDAGARPSEGNGDINAIVAACQNFQFDAAMALTKAGADLRGSIYLDAPLIYAVSHGQLELCKLMIEKGAEVPVYRSGVFGAAMNGHSNCVELLCSHGARIHEKDWSEVEAEVRKRSDVRSHIALLRSEHQRDAKTDAERQAISDRLEPALTFIRAAHEGRTDDLKSQIDTIIQQAPWAVEMATHYAKKEGRIDTIRLLQPVYSKAKRQAERKPRDLKSLTQAVKNKDVKKVKLLLERGVDPNYGDPNEFSPMMIAIQEQQTELVKLLLEHGADPSNDPGWNSRSPLSQACYRGTPEIVKLLLDAGADPNEGGDWTTPLYFSAGRGDVNSIELLIQAGAGVNLPFGDDKKTPLITAAVKGHEDAVVLLIQHGADLNKADANGVTPVQAAAATDKTEVARQLILLGAEVPENSEDLRPRITISDVNNPKRLKMLLKAGADPNIKSIKGFGKNITPLQELLSQTRIKHDCVVLLLDAGADLSLVEGPLVHAVSMQDNTVKLLIEAGADVNQADPNFLQGIRPIQMAAGRGKFELMRTLLEAGADPSLRATGSKLTLEQTVLGFPHVNQLIREERLEQARALLAEWEKRTSDQVDPAIENNNE